MKLEKTSEGLNLILTPEELTDLIAQLACQIGKHVINSYGPAFRKPVLRTEGHTSWASSLCFILEDE